MHVAAAGFASRTVAPSNAGLPPMKGPLSFLSLAATLLLGVPMVTPPPAAFACGEGQPEIVQAPPKNMVVFYTASRRATRCFVPWRGTPLTTTEMSLADARVLFDLRKKEARNKPYFRDNGKWFEYHGEDGKLYAVGYYGAREEPFSYKGQ